MSPQRPTPDEYSQLERAGRLESLGTPQPVAVDNSQNVFVAGETFSTNFFIANPLPQGSTNNGFADGFITEVNPGGTASLVEEGVFSRS